MAKIINLRDHRKPTAAPAAVDGDGDEDWVEGDEEDEEPPFRKEFAGTPDEIFGKLAAWLEEGPFIGCLMIMTVRPGCLVIEDEPDGWSNRDDDGEVWGEAFPNFLEDENGGLRVFDCDDLLRMIRAHEASFKALLASDLSGLAPEAEPFIDAFLRD